MVDADLIAVVRFVHIVLASFWVGGDVYFFLLVAPNLNAMGPAAEAFAFTLLRRGGFGRVLFPIATATILAGAFLYYALGYHRAPFADPPRTVLTLGAMTAVTVWLWGLFYFLPRERRMVRIGRAAGPAGPTPEQSAAVAAIAKATDRPSKVAVTLLGVAFVLMVGRTLV